MTKMFLFWSGEGVNVSSLIQVLHLFQAGNG